MAVSMANMGLFQMTTPSITPFGVASNPLTNNFNQQSFSSPNVDQSKIPWQQTNQQGSPWQQNKQQNSLWQLIQQNKQQIEAPFGQDNTNNNNNQMKQQFPWQQNQTDNNGNNEDNKDQSQEENWLQQLLKAKNETSNASKDDKESSQNKDEEMEEFQEKFEEWMEEVEEQKKETYNDFQLYVLLLYPFLIFDRPTATYFASAELLSTILTKYGINDDNNLLFLLFVQCVDIVALSRGRFKLVDGYQQNWYQEMFDYIATRIGMNDIIRLGAQMAMPQSPGPEYETKR